MVQPPPALPQRRPTPTRPGQPPKLDARPPNPTAARTGAATPRTGGTALSLIGSLISRTAREGLHEKDCARPVVLCHAPRPALPRPATRPPPPRVGRPPAPPLIRPNRPPAARHLARPAKPCRFAPLLRKRRQKPIAFSAGTEIISPHARPLAGRADTSAVANRHNNTAPPQAQASAAHTRTELLRRLEQGQHALQQTQRNLSDYSLRRDAGGHDALNFSRLTFRHYRSRGWSWGRLRFRGFHNSRRRRNGKQKGQGKGSEG